MAMGKALDEMGTAAVALIALAAITLVGIAVVTGFKDTGIFTNTSGVTNATFTTTADKFITGLTVFASFSSVIALAIVGKLIVSMFTKQ